MKPVLAVIAAAAFLLGPSAQPAAARPADGSVISLSVIPSSGKAEVVIGVAGGLEVSDFTLRAPDRIVLDLTAASLSLSRVYDKVSRGGITDVRYSLFKRGTVRIVITLDGPHSYQVSKSDGDVRVAVTVPAGAQFAAWHIGGGKPEARTASRNDNAAGEPTSGPDRAIDKAVANSSRDNADLNDARPMRTNVQLASQSASQVTQQAQQRSQQPRISVIYQGSDIRDVIAAFAALPENGFGYVTP